MELAIKITRIIIGTQPSTILRIANEIERKFSDCLRFNKGTYSFSIEKETISFEKKLISFAEDLERGIFVHFPNSFQEFRNNDPTLAFIRKPPQTNIKHYTFLYLIITLLILKYIC
ncbi:LOW QUALITY PROTEIN: hypothetical protein HZS_5542 [Henneguya salminicola]|nr:LOW QUALITY PROTEIN: hypothetical protein HZS_5542 [Henneguya salminicola]